MSLTKLMQLQTAHAIRRMHHERETAECLAVDAACVTGVEDVAIERLLDSLPLRAEPSQDVSSFMSDTIARVEQRRRDEMSGARLGVEERDDEYSQR